MAARLDLLLQLLKESPDDDFTLFAVAKEYEKLKNHAKALHFYEKLVQIHPDYVGTYYHFGKLLEGENQLENALEIYKKGIETAQKVQDLHALAELRSAKMNAEMEF